MTNIDRRTILGALALGTAGAVLGLSSMSTAAKATPLAAGSIDALTAENLVEKAQVIVVGSADGVGDVAYVGGNSGGPK